MPGNTVTCYCHNPACIRCNVPTEVGYYPATYDSPADWAEDPECRSCFDTLHEEAPLDIEKVLKQVQYALYVDWEDLPYDDPRRTLGASIMKAWEAFQKESL